MSNKRRDKDKIIATYPMSHGQRAMYFLYAAHPDTNLYSVHYVARVVSELNVGALESAYIKLFQRHPVMRSTYHVEDSKFLCKVHRRLEKSFAHEHLGSVTVGELDEHLSCEAGRAFDLSSETAVRVRVYTFDDRRPLIQFVGHHIAFDAWSLVLLVKETAAIYNDIVSGAPVVSLPLEATYGEFVVDEANFLASSELDKSLDFWRGELDGCPPRCDLPVDFPRAKELTVSRGMFCFPFEQGLTNEVLRLSKSLGVTPYAVYLSVFFALLQRYSSERDVVVTTPTARRDLKYREVYGYFINLVPVRAVIDETTSVEKFITELSRHARSCFEHNEVPFSWIANRHRGRDQAGAEQLHQISFSWEDNNAFLGGGESLISMTEGGTELFELGALRLERLPQRLIWDETEVSLRIVRVDDTVSAVLEFDEHLFERTTMQRMGAHYTRLLAQAVERPRVVLSELSLMSPEETTRIVADWNQTGSAHELSLTIHELFERQVDRHPSAEALIVGSQRLTYAELNAASNRLARVLVKRGVKPGNVIGVCLERSAELLVALLSILKAAAAYLPIDSSLPAGRRVAMLEDSRCSWVITNGEWADQFTEGDVAVLSLDSLAGELSASPSENLSLAAASSELAYVIFTSGSTGRPKGVQVTHRSVVGFLQSMADEPGMTGTDVLLAVTSVSFDISVLELFLPLSLGATVVLAESDDVADGCKLAQLLELHDVTVMQATPTTWELLERSDWSGKPELRAFCGGEALSTNLAARLLPKVSELWNLYGPTETTIWSTVARVTDARYISIGRPIADTQVYILDERLRPVPVGVRGVLYIGGVGVSAGYVGRPGLTAERFIESPFGSTPGERLYNTGDLARYHPDGTIECLGRIDHQVKIRGFRIETSEVEAAFLREDAVDECVVVARDGTDGVKRLVAYVVPSASEGDAIDEAGSSPFFETWRSKLKLVLPESMIPATLVRLDALPLNSNRKVDRNALPNPDIERRAQTPYVAPSTAMEQMMVEIFLEVLATKEVGVHDNFFDLGGDSIASVRVVNRLSSAGVPLSVRDVLECQTIAKLCERIEASERAHVPESDPLYADTPTDEVPLTPTQEGMLFHTLTDASSGAYISQYAIEIVGAFDPGRFMAAYARVAERHDALRTIFRWGGGTKPTQHVQATARPSLSKLDWGALTDDALRESLRAFLQSDRARGFGLDFKPPIRFVLIETGGRGTWLVFTYHHILMDGWSLAVVFKELFDAYAGRSEGEAATSALVPKYANYVHWLREKSQRVRTAEREYWSSYLKGFVAPTRLGVRASLSSADAKLSSVRSESVSLSPELTDSLRRLARDSHVTPNVVLLGAWGLLLSRYSGEDDVVFGVTLSGRAPELRGIDDAVGLFINTLPFRARFDGDLDVSAYLAETQRGMSELLAHQTTSLVDVKRWSDVSGGLRLFDSLLVYQNFPIAKSLKERELPVEIGQILEAGETNYPLTVVAAMDETLTISIKFDEQDFRASAMLRLLEHLRRLLSQMAAGPKTALSALSLMTKEEEEQVLRTWNAPEESEVGGKLLHELFEEQAIRAPEAVAIEFEGREMTYAALNRAANQLARYLLERGLSPETMVGVLLHKSFEAVIAFLAILKAGGVYLPLDPTYPAERLRHMMEDTRATFLLTRDSVSALPLNEAVQTLRLDRVTAEIEALDARNMDRRVDERSLAYVIYTSGSTGVPKGVMIEHRGVTALLKNQDDVYDIGPRDRILHFAPLSFDASIFELALSLHTGAVLCLGRKEELLGQALLAFLQEKRITWAEIPPSVLGTLPHRELPTLRQLVVAGEQCPASIAKTWSPGRRFINAYGPTESTVWATYKEVESAGASVPIGRPVGNTQAYILDEHLRPVPIGVAGELYIAGAQLARGYWNRPELTAARFVPNVFHEDPGSRLYRTGDRCRYLEDGDIEFLGRVDQQVKIRGCRVEVGEVEAALLAHPGVQECTVVARHGKVGGDSLVAYFVRADTEVGASMEPLELRFREFLRQTLPEFMIPALFVEMGELPRDANGKRDRTALPEPGSRLARETSYLAPRSETEVGLVSIWRDVLGLEEIGVEDSFFDIGGHSLLLLEVASRIETELGVSLSVMELLQHKSVEELASRVDREADGAKSKRERALVAQLGADARLVVELKEGTSENPPLFCIHPVDGTLFVFRRLLERMGEEHTIYGLQAKGFVEAGACDPTIERMAQRYLGVIRALQPEGPYYLLGASMGGVVASEIASRLVEAGDEVGLLAMIDSTYGAGLLENEVDELADQASEIYERMSPGIADRTKMRALVLTDSHRELLKANAHATNRYQGPSRVGDICFFAPQHASDHHLRRVEEQWGRGGCENLRVLRVPGDHLTMMWEPGVHVIAEALREGLNGD